MQSETILNLQQWTETSNIENNSDVSMHMASGQPFDTYMHADNAMWDNVQCMLKLMVTSVKTQCWKHTLKGKKAHA